MQHATGAYFNNYTSYFCEAYLGIKFSLTLLFTFLLFYNGIGQKLQDEVIIVPKDTVVILKKWQKSIEIPVKLINRTNADTLLIKNFIKEVPVPFYYNPEGSGFEKENCETSCLFFRIEELNGDILETVYSINIDKTSNTTKPSSKSGVSSVEAADSKNRKANISKDLFKEKHLMDKDLYLLNDTTLYLSLKLRDYFCLRKRQYNIYIYYCNIYEDRYVLQYKSSLIEKVPSSSRIPKKIFIGQFTSEAIKLVVK